MTTTATTYQWALDVMATTPDILRSIVDHIPEDALERRPAPDAWSVRDVLAHMAQGEAAMIGPRIQAMLTGENSELPAPAKLELPQNAAALVAAWADARQRNLAFFRAIAPDQLERTGRHARYGEISAGQHIIEWAYHDLDHLRQLLAALQAGLYGEIGAFQQLYPPPA